MQKSKSLETLLPFQSKFVTVSGFQMHYLDEGQGPVVLLLHGNPTWCFYYRNLITKLKKNFRVIAPDYIGCGLSERTKSTSFRAIDRIAQIQNFIDSLELKKFSLVMHDWGGSIGTGLALNNSDKIRRYLDPRE